ncbi:hypothetical protein Ddye_015954 [Dipteronia dyeriana]|uniref:Reverse transcriptase zinc-binding domain-containing protein n=1 Tax=Dipteronia dyeriana TaxID=168575 RepID=A0AAD9X013_9ROSI|nr:hypothetical protein Ddye_015954 [Dipteronia dyeriana]
MSCRLIKFRIMRSNLEVVFSVDEVWKVLSDCDRNKAPGPDGLNLNFIKANWEMIQEEAIHSWKKKGNGGLFVKLDFQKAYDSVDHEFLLEVLERRGLDGFIMVVGSGSKIRLWQDVRWDLVLLMTAFLRIFVLVSNKKGTVSEYGNWVESRWVWNGRVLVKDVLLSFGFQHVENNECPMCGGGFESINHLFLHCAWSDVVWRIRMGWWGVSSCSSPSVKEWADGSTRGCPGEAGIRGVLRDVRVSEKNMSSVDIKYMPRESNSFTDSLAKATSSGGRNILKWGDI